MTYSEARRQFISTWGALGSHWGINRTMAQIHALLLISAKPLNQDEVMEELQISRGNVNMNMRELISWNLVERVIVPGERREYFQAEKDIWSVATRIIRERKKQELDPLLQLLSQLEQAEGNAKDKDQAVFKKVVGDIHTLTRQADRLLTVLIKSEEQWLTGSLMKLIR